MQTEARTARSRRPTVDSRRSTARRLRTTPWTTHPTPTSEDGGAERAPHSHRSEPQPKERCLCHPVARITPETASDLLSPGLATRRPGRDTHGDVRASPTNRRVGASRPVPQGFRPRLETHAKGLQPARLRRSGIASRLSASVPHCSLPRHRAVRPLARGTEDTFLRFGAFRRNQMHRSGQTGLPRQSHPLPEFLTLSAVFSRCTLVALFHATSTRRLQPSELLPPRPAVVPLDTLCSHAVEPCLCVPSGEPDDTLPTATAAIQRTGPPRC